MRSKIIKSIILFLFVSGILWTVSASTATAKDLLSSPTIIVDGGGQAAIENAIDQAQPGDTILVKAGDYDNNDPLVKLEINASATADEAPITLLGENRPRLGTIEISDSSHFIIEGFEIADQTSDSFFVGMRVKRSNNIIIRDMLIHHLTATAISTGDETSDILVEDSTIYEVVPRQTDGDAHCFINSSAKNITFRNNECYGFIGDGYQAYRDGATAHDRGITIIEGNRIYNTKGPCSENAVDIKGERGTVIIRGNILNGFREMDESQCTVYASGCGACQALNIQDGSTGDLLIENNKIFDSDNGIFNNEMNATVQNNIFYDIYNYVIYDTGLSSKYYHNTFVNARQVFQEKSAAPQEVINNLFYNAGDTVSGTYSHNGWFGNNTYQVGPGDVMGSDPLLNLDYSPQDGSPVIDRGMDQGITTDFTGILNIRPDGPAPDIGAFEFTGTSSNPTPTPEPPNPTPTSEPPNDTITLIPIEDTHANADEPTTNFGNATNLEIDGTPVKVTYLKFDLSNLLADEVVAASLRLYVQDASNSAQNIKLVDNNWTESGLTFEDRPIPTNTIASLNGGEVGTWIEVDLTESIKAHAGQLLSLAIDSTGSNGLDVASKEASANHPHLLVVTEAPAEPGPDPIILTLSGPASVVPGETFVVGVQAINVGNDGLYGVQFEINYDPTLISVSDLQVNPDLSFVVLNNADNTTGKIRVAASREGNVPGLTGDLTLLTFDATALGISGATTLDLDNEVISDPQARGLDATTNSHTLSIGETATPEPIPEPTDEPTADPTDPPTAEPTDEPIPDPTAEPTSVPTDEPTADPTDVPTPEPTDELTPEPTDLPIPEPTDEPIPQPTDDPAVAAVFGQVILAGQANNDWSGATLTIAKNAQLSGLANATTDPEGNFTITNVVAGVYESVTADAAGYLPAVCVEPSITAPETALAAVTLLSGDIDNDDLVDITDATAIGITFGTAGPELSTDINRDQVINIFDIVLVTVNFGQETQVWNCQNN